MTASDFLESLFARLRRITEETQWDARLVPEPLHPFGSLAAVVAAIEKAPLFVLGSWDEITSALKEYRGDLVEDLEGGLLAPFPSVTLAYETGEGWVLEWLSRLGPGSRGDRYLFLWFRQGSEGSPYFRNLIEFEFGGKRGGEFMVHLMPETLSRYHAVDRRARELVELEMGHLLEDALFRVALLSHPAHYLVQRTPNLTPREQRREREGAPRPIRKRPYFIVVDPQGLQEIRTEASGETRPSPSPHQRRGHWMRLSDRCRIARQAGRSRVWVRETFVGEREFAGRSARYKVFLSASDLADT